jgi:8-oxo-dGTP diphosphatase
MRVPSETSESGFNFVAYYQHLGPEINGIGETPREARSKLTSNLDRQIAIGKDMPKFQDPKVLWVPAEVELIGEQKAATFIDHHNVQHELLVDESLIRGGAVRTNIISYDEMFKAFLVEFPVEDTRGNHRCWVDAIIYDYKEITPKQVRVGVSAVVFKDSTHQEVLLGLRKGSHAAGTWAFPGGHQEFGESPDETAVRETWEETDLNVKVVGYSVWTNTEYPEEGKQYITLFIECELLNPDDWDKVVNKEPGKCLEWLWFDKNWMPTPLMPCIPDNLFPKE